MKLRQLVSLTSFLFATSQGTIAQTPPSAINITRIQSPVVIDGIIDEPAWSGITTVPYVVHKPIFGSQPTENTELLLAYDENYLYVAGKMFDSEPTKIQATSFKRDSDRANSEWFGVALDTYNDKENAVGFFTTPTGLRWDATIVEGTGGITVNPNWNTYWDVATTRDTTGWFAEFRIPLSSLRFQDQEGKVTMALISWRLVSRKNEWIIFPAISDEWGGASFYKVSKAHEITLEGIKPRKPVYFSPYLLASRGMVSQLDESGKKYLSDYSTKVEPGLDVKFGLSKNATMDITVNTDFAQVEVDDRIVNLDRTSVFLPEKRQFFQERSRSFEFDFDDSNQVFYSRRVGIENGTPIRIYGGIRSVARIGKNDVGFLSMQTGERDTVPSSNLSVLRLKRQIINQNSYVGGIATSKFSANGKYNVVYGFDGLFRLPGHLYIKAAAVQSVGEQEWKPFAARDSRYLLNFERRATDGLGYSISSSWVGERYNPEMGFESRQNYHAVDAKIAYRWFASKEHFLYRTTFSTNPSLIRSNADKLLQSSKLPVTAMIETKSGWSFSVTPSLRYEKVDVPLTFLGSLQVMPGEYSFSEVSVTTNSPSIKPFYASATVTHGSFYDGKKSSLLFAAVWNPSAHLELEGTYQTDKILFPESGQKRWSHLYRLKGLYMLNTKFSLAMYLQYTNWQRSVLSNIRFRYNPREGRDLYLVFNQNTNTQIGEEALIRPTIDSWSLNVKYVYTFIR